MRPNRNFKTQTVNRRGGNFLLMFVGPARWLSKNLSIIAVFTLIGTILLSIFLYFFYYSYAPQEEAFASCKSFFVKIKEKPTYGIVIDIKQEKVEGIHILGVNQEGHISINIKSDNWVRVYFSEKFNYSQVSELIRLSQLETGKVNYCWLSEQLSLLTGVPLEYMIVRENGIPVISNLKFFEIFQILGNFDKSDKRKIDLVFVPQEILEDGTKVNVLSFSSFRDQFPQLFKLQEVTNEQAFVEVYNSTPISGYASLVSHKLTMLGIEVSRVGNASYQGDTGLDAVVYVRNREQYQKTIELIISALPTGGKVEIKSGRPEGIVTTGDIVVILLKR
jgi:hypothetical protein